MESIRVSTVALLFTPRGPCTYFSGPQASLCKIRASLLAQLVKNPPATQETPAGFLGWKDPLEKG